MRFSTPIYFQHIQSTYNATTGNYEDTITETKRFASVTDAGEETMRLVYDGVKQGSKVIRLQRPFTSPFDNIRIGSSIYRVDKAKAPLTKHILVVSEVQ